MLRINANAFLRFIMEIFDIVDKNGKIIGKADRKKCHSDKKLIHPVAHIIVINTNNELLLQLRSKQKKIQPGKWDTSVGGHIVSGESPEQGMIREVKEELGILPKPKPDFLYNYIMYSDIETEYVYTYKMEYNGPFNFNKQEIDKIKFWSIPEIKNNLGTGIFTPNFEQEFSYFLDTKKTKR